MQFSGLTSLCTNDLDYPICNNMAVYMFLLLINLSDWFQNLYSNVLGSTWLAVLVLEVNEPFHYNAIQKSDEETRKDFSFKMSVG